MIGSEDKPDYINGPEPRFGMTSEELAEYVDQLFTAVGAGDSYIEKCKDRITGVGHDQYAEVGYQKFEFLGIGELFNMLLEEVEDIGNYATFIVIRIGRFVEQLLGQFKFSDVELSVEQLNDVRNQMVATIYAMDSFHLECRKLRSTAMVATKEVEVGE